MYVNSSYFKKKYKGKMLGFNVIIVFVIFIVLNYY